MEHKNENPLVNPNVDISQLLRVMMGDTGELHEAMGGFVIDVYHAKAFPWGEVFRALLYRDFRVYVTRRKADLRIEASV